MSTPPSSSNRLAAILVTLVGLGLVWGLVWANMPTKDANEQIQIARAADGNEGLTINDVTPDWIRTRGIDFAWDWAWSPQWGAFDYGGLLPSY